MKNLFASTRSAAAISIALFYYILMFTFAWLITPEDRKESIMSITIGACAASIGWLLGVVASPYTEDEDTRFKTIIGALATFLSGFGIASLMQNVDLTNFQDYFNNKYTLLWFRILCGIMSFIASFQTTYAVRAYEISIKKDSVVNISTNTEPIVSTSNNTEST